MTETDLSHLLGKAISTCTRCDLSKSRTRTVPLLGEGSVVIVGEGPGREEDELGVPFVGPAGQVLNGALKQAGIPRKSVATMNLVACRPPGNDFDQAISCNAPAACRTWFEEQLIVSRAWIVVMVGAIPYQHIAKRHLAAGARIPEPTGITRARGNPWWWEGRLYFPTFHPSYIMRTGGLTGSNGPTFISDLRQVYRYDAGLDSAPVPDRAPLFPLTGRHQWLHSKDTPTTIYADLLGEEVLVVPTLREKEKLPQWTLAELARARWGLHDMEGLATLKRHVQGELFGRSPKSSLEGSGSLFPPY